ncbi:NAD(P)H-hydrate dehydratase [Flavobacteriaceae bacterium F08102]|nr:NAD(P)H-hydrate dehydratase [Flavobacteriaceae bacterium F08102]
MPKILSVAQLYEADKITTEKNKISISDLMEHVGTLCFQWIHRRLKGDQITIKVFCGTGNNGGDGLVMARHLKQYGYNVQTYVVNCSNDRSEVFLKKYDELKEIGVWPEMITCDDDFPEISRNDMVVDAIFGIGLSRSPANVLKSIIQHINASDAYVLSIDLPSGMFAEKPVEDFDAVIKAYHILTFETPKISFFLPENEAFVRSWEVIVIGLDNAFMQAVKPLNYLITKPDVLPIYKFRKKFSHKGDYGHALIIGGSKGKIGSMVLSAKAAIHMGSGLVTARVPACGYQIMQTSVAEVMVEIGEEDHLETVSPVTAATVIGIGMGLGTDKKTEKGFTSFIKTNKLPLVIDADAINLLAKNQALIEKIPENSIFTPHPKEFERLVGTWKNDYEKLDKLRAFASKYKVIVVLKGAYSAIASSTMLYFNSTGNPGLATAGSGDVLSGMITALIAQGYSALEAAIFGVYLHGRTADLAMKDMVFETFVASDIINYLPEAFIDLFQKPPATNPQKDAENEKQNETTTR